MGTSCLRINMTGANHDPMVEAERYRAALDMAVFAEDCGFDVVNVEEHHCADNGWLASPLTMASMIAARTERVQIGIMALLVNLYDPVRLAEDIAVIDVVSRGRLAFIAGQGYRPIEYHAMDKDWDGRGAQMDFILETLLKAWTGEPFEYRGETIRVSPRPFSRPHPVLMVGGMGKNAARRAAKFGLPFYPPANMPELEAFYLEELERQGRSGWVMSPREDSSILFIDEEPERAWDELGQYFLTESLEYSSWKREGVPRPLDTGSDSIDALRETGMYEIITPEECLSRFQRDSEYSALLHPLVGGMPLDRAWRCLRLYQERVMSELASS